MKKKTIGLILSLLISIGCMACHFNDGKKCGDKLYLHGYFSPNSIFEFRFYGSDSTVVKRFSTGDHTGEIDSTIIFDVPNSVTNIKIAFRNHYLSDSLFNNWAGNYNANLYYEVIDTTNSACHVLAVSISNLIATKSSDDSIHVSFTPGEETGTDHYNLLMSATQNNWTQIQEIKPKGLKNYIIVIGVGISFAFIIPIFGLFDDNKKRRKLSLILYSSLLFLYSCNKIVEKQKTQSYKFVCIQGVSTTGQTSTLAITSIK